MSRGYLFKIEQDGHRSSVLEYRNAHAGFSLIRETVTPVLLGRPAQQALNGQILFEAMRNPVHPQWAKVALAVTHERTWIHHSHLDVVIKALEKVAAEAVVEEPVVNTKMWRITPVVETNAVPKIVTALKGILEDPTAFGAHFYWYSVIQDFALRQVRGEDPSTGEVSCDEVECNFLDPKSRALHGLFELFEFFPCLS